MSWSVSIIGNPERVAEELSKYSDTLTGQSRTEYDEARPHLQSLVSLTVGQGTLVSLNASGHAAITEGKKTYGNCTVSLTQFYSKLAL